MKHIKSFSDMTLLLESEKNTEKMLQDIESETKEMVADLEKQGIKTKSEQTQADILKSILISEFDIDKAKEKIEESLSWKRTKTGYTLLNEAGDGVAGTIVEILEHSEIGHHFKEKFGHKWWAKALGFVVKVLKLPISFIEWAVQWIARKLGASFENAQIASNVVLGLLAIYFLYIGMMAAAPFFLSILTNGFSIGGFVAILKAGLAKATLAGVTKAVMLPIKMASSTLSLKHKKHDIEHEAKDHIKSVNDLLDILDKERKKKNFKPLNINYKWQLDTWYKKDKSHQSIVNNLVGAIERFHDNPKFDSKSEIKRMLSLVKDDKVRQTLTELLKDYITTRMKGVTTVNNKRARFLDR